MVVMVVMMRGDEYEITIYQTGGPGGSGSPRGSVGLRENAHGNEQREGQRFHSGSVSYWARGTGRYPRGLRRIRVQSLVLKPTGKGFDPPNSVDKEFPGLT